jgi:hypothetical protein
VAGTDSDESLLSYKRRTLTHTLYTHTTVEAAEGRTGHNNSWNGVIGMASNMLDTIPLDSIPATRLHSSHYYEPSTDTQHIYRTHSRKQTIGEHRKNLSPLLLCQDEFGEIGVQLVLLVNALLLDAVPALLLGYPEGTGNVVTKVQPLLFRQVIC